MYIKITNGDKMFEYKIRIEKWKIVLFFSLFLVYAIFLFAIINEKKKLPSENISKGIQIFSNNELDIIDNKKSNLLDMVIAKDNIYIVNLSNKFEIANVEKNGDILKKKEIDLKEIVNTKDVKDINMTYNKNNLEVYILYNDILYKYIISSKDFSIISLNIIDKNVQKVNVLDDYILIYKNLKVNILKSNKLIKELYVEDISKIDFYVYEDNIYILYVLNNTELKLLFTDVDDKDSIKKISIDKFNDRIKYISIRSDKDYIHILAESEEFKTGKIVLKHYMYNAKESKIDRLYGLEYNIDPKLIDINEENYSFIISTPEVLGKDKVVYNIYKIFIQDGEIVNTIRITNTKYKSVNCTVYREKFDEYYLWTDLKAREQKVYLASNNKEFIKKSLPLNHDEKMETITTWIVSIFPTLLGTLITIVAVSGATLLALIIFSVKFLNIMEQNNKVVFIVAFITHNISKVLFIKNMIFDNKNIVNIKESLPYFLINPSILFLLTLTLTLISYYIAKLNKAINYREFLLKYLFFSLVDVLLLSLLIVPYFYIYLALPMFR